ncbi:hypothetical protein Tco_0811508 [Tanacetum coccineum]
MRIAKTSKDTQIFICGGLVIEFGEWYFIINGGKSTRARKPKLYAILAEKFMETGVVIFATMVTLQGLDVDIKLSIHDIDYVDASSPDVEIVSLEVVEIVDPEVGRIDDDILLTIKDDILREKLLNVNLLIAKIDALRDNPTLSSDVLTKSTSTFSNLFLEETNTFDNSIPESETFRFNLEEISSGSPTTHSELSLPDYKAFYVDNDHFKEKSSGSTTTQVDFSQYDSFIFDLSNDQFPPADRSDLYHEEFTDELAHIMSLLNLECFKFRLPLDSFVTHFSIMNTCKDNAKILRKRSKTGQTRTRERKSIQRAGRMLSKVNSGQP